MSWRPEGLEKWDAREIASHVVYDPQDPQIAMLLMIEAGADAMLEVLNPLLTQIYAQLCGARIQMGKTDWYSTLDDSIDRLKSVLYSEQEAE